MNAIRLIALVLVIGGALAIAFGGFTYTKDKDAVKLGPVEFSITQKERVNIPLWAGIAAVVGGVLLLAVGRK